MSSPHCSRFVTRESCLDSASSSCHSRAKRRQSQRPAPSSPASPRLPPVDLVLAEELKHLRHAQQLLLQLQDGSLRRLHQDASPQKAQAARPPLLPNTRRHARSTQRAKLLSAPLLPPSVPTSSGFLVKPLGKARLPVSADRRKSSTMHHSRCLARPAHGLRTDLQRKSFEHWQRDPGARVLSSSAEMSEASGEREHNWRHSKSWRNVLNDRCWSNVRRRWCNELHD